MKFNIFQAVRKFGLVLAVVASVLAVQLAAARPAFAVTTCGSGNFCIWQHARNEGWKLEYYSPSYGCHTLSSYYWDQASSVWNRTGHTITAYTLQNCTGIGWDIYGTEAGEIRWPFNDEMRSFYVNP